LEAAVGRRVDIETAGAEELYGLVAGDVAAADGQDLCLTAVDAWAGAKVAGLVLFGHLLDALARGDVALVDQAVQHLGAALHDGQIRSHAHVSLLLASVGGRIPHVLIIVVQILVFVFIVFVAVVVLGLDVEDHLQSFLVHGDLALQAGQVEVVLDKVLGDLSKVLVADEAAEGRDPRLGYLAAGRHVALLIRANMASVGA
jgi:hypothetical protein